MTGAQQKIQNFWQQVEQTIDGLLSSESENQFANESLLLEYRKTLQSIDTNLTFHFEREESDGAVEMIFGCDGYPESISSVLHLVGEAPVIGGVKFVAFNSRYDPIPETVAIGEELYDIDEFWFGYRLESGRLHLDVYMSELPRSLELEPRTEAVMIWLDALIGEYDLMTRVSTLSWYELPTEPLDFSLKPLAELRELFDNLRQQIMPIGLTYH